MATHPTIVAFIKGFQSVEDNPERTVASHAREQSLATLGRPPDTKNRVRLSVGELGLDYGEAKM